MNHNAIMKYTSQCYLRLLMVIALTLTETLSLSLSLLLMTEVARLQAEHDSKAYARARADAYAPIGDQMDMQYWDSVNGSRTWLDHIEAVKEAHPK